MGSDNGPTSQCSNQIECSALRTNFGYRNPPLTPKIEAFVKSTLDPDLLDLQIPYSWDNTFIPTNKSLVSQIVYSFPRNSDRCGFGVLQKRWNTSTCFHTNERLHLFWRTIVIPRLYSLTWNMLVYHTNLAAALVAAARISLTWYVHHFSVAFYEPALCMTAGRPYKDSNQSRLFGDGYTTKY